MSTFSGKCHSYDTDIKDFLFGEGGERDFYFNIHVSVYEVLEDSSSFFFWRSKAAKNSAHYCTAIDSCIQYLQST